MSKVLDWIKAHVWQTILIVLAAFLLPLIIVHVMYKTNAISPFFVSTWGPGDLTTYVAGFLAFLGSVVLGAVAVYQNQKANDINNRMIAANEKQNKFTRQPCIMITGAKRDTIQKDNEQSFIILSFTNATNVYTQFSIDSISFGDVAWSLTRSTPLGESVLQEAPISQLKPFETNNISIHSAIKDFNINFDCSCTLILSMLNSIGEEYIEKISFCIAFPDDKSISLSKFTYDIEE